MAVRSRRDPVRLTLWADAAFELVVGIVLLAAIGPLSDWLALDKVWLVALSVLFFLAALVIGAMALRRIDPATVMALAIANIIGGIVLWAILALAWHDVEPGGRWLVTAVADSFLLIGLLEFVALRLTRR